MAEILEPEAPVQTLFADLVISQAKGKKAKSSEDADLFDDEEVATPKKAGKSKEDQDEEGDDGDDDWSEGGEDEEEEWDPDFEEFDLPKSRKGKSKAGDEEDEDYKVDDEFSDLYGDDGDGENFDDDDDF